LDLKAIKGIVSSDFNYLFNELENDLIENEFIVTKTKKT
jgi:homoserine dehydrogenase